MKKPIQELRWWIAGAVLAVVVALHVLPEGYFPLGDARRIIFDLAHVFVFAAIAYAATRALTHGPLTIAGFRVPPLLGAAVFALSISVLAETSQVISSRDASYGDLLRDGYGIAGGLLVALASSGRIWQRGILALAGLSIIVLGAWNPGLQLASRILAGYRFPILATFENSLDALLVRPMRASVEIIPAPVGWATPGHVALIRTVAADSARGIYFTDLPHEWAPFRRLRFDIAAAEAPLEIIVRIDDDDYYNGVEDRFNLRLKITENRSIIRIPLEEVAAGPVDRRMDLKSIHRLMIYVPPGQSGAFLIDNLQLE